MLIPLNDLKRTSASSHVIDAAVRDVLASGWYLMGEALKRFEQEFAAWCGAEHCLGVANGTDAIELSLRALGVEPGARVVTAANAGGYASTAIHAIGAHPTYVDVTSGNACIDPGALELVIQHDRPAAIIVTHLYGVMAPVERVIEIAAARGIPVLEDCAQAHGAHRGGRRVGSYGDAAAFSFYPTKNLGCAGDGGAVTTSNAGVAQMIARLRQYGWSRKYETALPGGRNSRLDEIQAAILSAKLPQLESQNARRRAIVRRYQGGIVQSAIERFERGGDDDVGHLYFVRAGRREELRAHLTEAGIGSDAHYPIPDHRQPAFRERYQRFDLPVTERLCREVLSLPCFPELTDDEVDRVIGACNAWKPA